MDTEARLSKLLSSTPVVPDYSQKWSHHGRKMKHQMMGKGFRLVTEKTIILDVGQPNSSISPVTGVKIKLSDGKEIELEQEHLENLSLYMDSDGLPELKQWLLKKQRDEHKPPQMVMDNHPSKFDLCVITGITGALYVCFMALMEEGDIILMEDVTYANFIYSLQTEGMNIQGVQCDDKGIIPESLEDELMNWNQRHPGKNMPKLLYTVTSSSNPVGYNWHLSRMLDVYLICRKYDILIMDDGAYHYLQYGERPRSFQSFDVDGRVIRFDTFSKIIGGGYRLGWVSGPEAIIDKVIIDNELTCVHASVLTQAAVYSMLKCWGIDGFEKHARSVANFYKKRAECVINACEKHLKGLATWTVPKGGMFLWITYTDSVPDYCHVIASELKEDHDIQVIRGDFFQTDPSICSRSFRISFSLASEDAMEKGIKCLGDVLRRRAGHGKLNNGVAH